jgi:U3 small nucleolar RNA-associated protein 7
MYDSNGTELHKFRSIRDPKFLEYLPYHYLLVALSSNGSLNYHDLTKGDIVNVIRTTPSPLCMKKNPWNATILIGDALGVVRLYSPNQGTSLMSLLTHKGSVD